MLLYFHAKIASLRISYLEFFEIAYIAQFNKLGHVAPDYCEFLQHGILPKYVITYLEQMQAKEREEEWRSVPSVDEPSPQRDMFDSHQPSAPANT